MTSITFITFIAFTAFVASVSYWKTRHDRMKEADDYFLGGRSLSAWVIAGSLMLTNLSTEQLIGMNADSYKHTAAIMAWETTSALAMVATALYFLPMYLRRGLTTIPEYLASRYDETTRVLASAIFLFSYVFAFLPVVLVFGASGLENIFNVSEQFGITQHQGMLLMVWSIGTLGSLYAIFGGLKAVAISDTINGIGFLILGLLVPYLGLRMMGDGSVVEGLSTLFVEERPKFDITGDEPGSFLPIGVLFTGMIVNQIFYWCVNQAIIQRALGAKNLKEGQKGVLIAAFLKLLGPLILVLPGIIAYAMFKDELTADQSIFAYPMLVKAVLPTWLVGLFAAVLVGAILSTFNSVLNSSATLFAQGVYPSIIKRESSGLELIKVGRIFSVSVAISSMFIAGMLDTGGSLFNYLQKINATFFGPMLAILLLGMFTKKVSATAAKTGLIIGPIMFYLLVFHFGDQVQYVLKSYFGLADDIHFLHFLAAVFIMTIAVMVGISRFKPQAEKGSVEEIVPPVDMTPWRYGVPVGIAISIATIGMFFVFTQ
ncbi:MAG: SSS family solute:Na+ symporter [Paraglaciecola sp.]|jgi:SSS family solute:Na+ symporter